MFKDLFVREGFQYDYNYDWCAVNVGRRSSSKKRKSKKNEKEQNMKDVAK